MNDSNGRFSSSRVRVGTSHKVVDAGRNIKSKTIPQRTITKRDSWTSLATKARRLSKKRKTSSLGSSRTQKETEDNLPKTGQCYGKSLEGYTAWCNHYLLRGLHREISSDLRTAVGDGVTLINLVESLARKTIPGASRQPVTWSQKLENIQVCFQFLSSEGVRVKGISPEDIIEGHLNGIINLFQCLETHFECISYPSGRRMDRNHVQSPVTGLDKNGRMSSGYHSEDDAYNNGGRTTPIIDALPGLLAGSDTNSETDDDDVVEPSAIRLHHNDPRTEPSLRESAASGFSALSAQHHDAVKFHHSQNVHRHSRAEETLDNIGYMPSHPSAKARTSASKTQYGKRNDSASSPENKNSRQTTSISPSRARTASPGHPVMLMSEDDHEGLEGRDNFGLDMTASDFGIDDSTSLDRRSISSTGTPVLPDLSSTSSFEDLPLDFSSDASGFARENFASSTKLSSDSFAQDRPFDAVDIQKQVESLHFMYQKLLALVGKESLDGKRKNRLSLPKMPALQAKQRNASKQRTKDMKSVSRRFARIESHLVTLARSVDHLRSEIRGQADTSRQVEELRANVNEFKDSIYSNSFYIRHHLQKSRDYQQRLHRLQKLKSFFGEEPPLVAILLQRMGYERFIPHFKAEEIGILELPYMTEQRLQNIGIPLGPRLRILEEIQKLR